jgi:UDP-GlcNAc:undecaprenyl-phosphate GlcNAc-1-phosphate transferase
MPPYTKLVGQLAIGCVVVLSGIRIELVHWPWLSIPLSVFWFVFVMNAFNLLDNMDGLAAGVGVIAAAFCAFHAALGQQWVVVALDLALCGACLGFLLFNFPPAKIFMGDSGSHLLGLNLAALALFGSWRHSTQLLSVLAVPLLLLAVPIFDTCFVTIQRLAHRQHPFVGGTDHVSHRLAILGLSTRRTVLALYGVSAALGWLSIASVFMRPITALVVWLFALAGLVLVGCYLSQVKVYRLEERTAEPLPAELTRSVTLVETMLMHKRRLVEVMVDFALVSGTYVFAHLLRFEGSLTLDLQQLVVQSLPVILVVKLGSFAACGLYRGVWRYMGLSDLIMVFRAVSVGSGLALLVLLYLWRFEGYSRAVLIIDWMLTFLAVGGSRVAERLLDAWISGATAQGAPLVIIGAGDSGVRVLRLLREESRTGRRIVGFLDDDARRHGSRIQGAPVLGGRARLPELIRDLGVREVLIALTDPPGELLQYIQRCCEPHGVTWHVVTAGILHAHQ